MRNYAREGLKQKIEDKLRSHFGVSSENATDTQIFSACAIVIRELMSRRMSQLRERDNSGRQVHYLSMEFLIGRSLSKNAFNTGVLTDLYGALKDMGKQPADIFEIEPDAGLGNGGLGRLAACYMDSMATMQIPATGYSILYELGIFKQKLEQGQQTEVSDDWLELGENWLIPKYEDEVEVRFGGRLEPYWDYHGNYHAQHIDYTSIIAVPWDMLISGYGIEQVNTLRLWEAKSPKALDMYLFSSGEYLKSLEQRIEAEVITKILYPADNHPAGKSLRIQQQYFFVSATVQSVVKKHVEKFGGVQNFAKCHVMHINDTHPTLIIPELMRIFMDDYKLGWDDAWEIVTNCTAYTNHTVLSEALERWPQGLIQQLLPRIWEIIMEINDRWRKTLSKSFGGDMRKVAYNLIINDGLVNMANMCLAACYKINGVSGLHGDILKNELFRDIYGITPQRFTYVTNGIDHRRWLAQINPRLHVLIHELIGEEYLNNSEELIRLKEFINDEDVLNRLETIKYENKKDFVEFVKHHQGFTLNPDAVFDVQIKRLHEYKRQLMCAMLITHLQNKLRNNEYHDFLPRTFLFGAKAASAYSVAKRIIQLICSLASDVNSDPACQGKLQVLFLENYRVSLAEALIPASQVSEQISTAGKEASGTGNMKLMMNGAVTIGTLDGANVEMYDRLGDDNMFLFGLRANEVQQLKSHGYNPQERASANSTNVLNRFQTGFSDGISYSDIVSRLLYGGDEFMLLADFDSYADAHERLYRTMSDKHRRSEISLVNIAESGFFSADRAISEYSGNIWNL